MVVEEVLIAPPTGDQVRIRMVSAGICASDGHLAWGEQFLADYPGHSTPIVLGHEGAGVVESIGEKVTSVQVGDHVLTTITPACRDCENCSSPLTNLCSTQSFLHLAYVPNKKLLNGTDVKGIGGLGVYSEYTLLRQSQIVKINRAANLENAAIISCAVATGYFAAQNQAKVQPGTTAAVWGLGAIGLNAVYGCKMAGAKNIIGIDINEDKKEVALAFGVTEFVNPKTLDVPIDEYLKQNYPNGIDYAFDCIGNQTVIDTAHKSLSLYGTLVLVGVPPKGTSLLVDVANFLTGKKVVGAFLGGKDCQEGYTELVEMYVSGRYDVDRLVTNTFSLEQINEAFQFLKEGKCIRSLIRF